MRYYGGLPGVWLHGVLTLGVTLLKSSALSVSATYTLEAASGYTANIGDVQVRWNF